MPIYEYRCEQCGRTKEKFHPVIPKEIPEVIREVCPCEDVGLAHFHRVMSAPNFRINGYSYKNGYSDVQTQDNTPVVSVTEPEG